MIGGCSGSRGILEDRRRLQVMVRQDLVQAVIGVAVGGLGALVQALNPTMPATAVLGTVASSLALSWVSTKLEQLPQEEERRRNHHLKRALAASLRHGFNEVAEAAPGEVHSCFAIWDWMAQQAIDEPNGALLDLLLPGENLAAAFDGANQHLPSAEIAMPVARLLETWSELAKTEADRFELSDLLRERVGAIPDATLIEKYLLAAYQAGFREAVTGDRHGFILAAFAVRSAQQAEAHLRESLGLTKSIKSDTGQMLPLVQELHARVFTPPPPGSMRGWIVPAPTPYFVGRAGFLGLVHDELSQGRGVLVYAEGGGWEDAGGVGVCEAVWGEL
jgi:hypothetical protein